MVGFIAYLVVGGLFAYVNVMALSFVSLLCSIFMNVCRFLIVHVRLVLERGSANLYGVVWATCVHNMGVMVDLELPSFASVSTMSIRSIHV
jgi:hypothetical protein